MLLEWMSRFCLHLDTVTGAASVGLLPFAGLNLFFGCFWFLVSSFHNLSALGDI